MGFSLSDMTGEIYKEKRKEEHIIRARLDPPKIEKKRDMRDPLLCTCIVVERTFKLDGRKHDQSMIFNFRLHNLNKET